MFKTYRKFVWALLLLPVLAVADTDDGDFNSGEADVVIKTEQVPPNVLKTAEKARPNAYFVRIMRMIKRDDEIYYVFDASQVGKYWTIKVRADGKLMEVNQAAGPPVMTKD